MINTLINLLHRTIPVQDGWFCMRCGKHETPGSRNQRMRHRCSRDDVIRFRALLYGDDGDDLMRWLDR
jgi:hypothetical protein